VCVCVCVCVCVFGNSRDYACMQVKRNKLQRKVLYHFAIFAIVIEQLTIKSRRMCAHLPSLQATPVTRNQRVARV